MKGTSHFNLLFLAYWFQEFRSQCGFSITIQFMCPANLQLTHDQPIVLASESSMTIIITNISLACLHVLSLQLTSDQSYSASKALKAILVDPSQSQPSTTHWPWEAPRHTITERESPYPGHCLFVTQCPFRFLPCQHKMASEEFFSVMDFLFFKNKTDLCRYIDQCNFSNDFLSA